MLYEEFCLLHDSGLAEEISAVAYIRRATPAT